MMQPYTFLDNNDSDNKSEELTRSDKSEPTIQLYEEYNKPCRMCCLFCKNLCMSKECQGMLGFLFDILWFILLAISVGIIGGLLHLLVFSASWIGKQTISIIDSGTFKSIQFYSTLDGTATCLGLFIIMITLIIIAIIVRIVFCCKNAWKKTRVQIILPLYRPKSDEITVPSESTIR